MTVAGHTVLDMLTFASIFLLVFLPLSYFHVSGVDPFGNAWEALIDRL